MRRILPLVPLCLALALPASAAAARREQPLPQPNPGFPDVVRTLVSIDAPLPASAKAPAACDRLSYVRYRSRRGPLARGRADATVVAMPGTLAGAGSLTLQALKVVQDAAQQGRAVEYWTLDRRSNCLEDNTGLDAARRSGNAATALDYYYRGTPVDGKRFTGFLRSRDIPYVADFGVRRTLEDWRTVLLRELPSPGYRQGRTFCAGHSLGGSLAGLLMAWDFDGDPATRADAGYHLCAGTAAQDSTTDLEGFLPTDELPPALLRGIQAPLTYATVTGAIKAGVVPRDVDLGIISPEVQTLLAGIGINATQKPDADTSDLARRVPTRSDAELAMRFFASPTPADALAPVAKLRRLHLSGEALLGLFMDDNTQQLPFVDASIGSFDGPVVASRFPLPLPGYVLPDDEDAAYGWNGFRDPQAAYTTAGSEVTDIQDLGRILPDQGADFLEHYYPTRLTTDALFASLGSRVGDLRHIRYPTAAALRPRLTLTAQDGLGPDPSPPLEGVPSEQVVLPGYNHLDAITAAATQADGRPEASAAAEAAFVLANTGRTWPGVPASDGRARPEAEVAARARALVDAAPVLPALRRRP